MSNFFNTRLEFLRTVGSTQRAQLLGKELGLFTYGDLIQRYPFRYLDRTQLYNVADLHDDLPYVQVTGMLRGKELMGEGPKQRLAAKVGDGTGELELVWFKGVKWVQQIHAQQPGVHRFRQADDVQRPAPDGAPGAGRSDARPSRARASCSRCTTPPRSSRTTTASTSKAIMRMVAELLKLALPHITESLSPALIEHYALMRKAQALQQIHFPQSRRAAGGGAVPAQV